ncbi:unnamed protein product [Ectocarpus sp. 8 AP-2014]
MHRQSKARPLSPCIGTSLQTSNFNYCLARLSNFLVFRSHRESSWLESGNLEIWKRNVPIFNRPLRNTMPDYLRYKSRPGGVVFNVTNEFQCLHCFGPPGPGYAFYIKTRRYMYCSCARFSGANNLAWSACV